MITKNAREAPPKHRREATRPPPGQRVLIARAMARSALSLVALLLLYYLLPFDRPYRDGVHAGLGIALAVALLAFAGIVGVQIRRIARSAYPGLRAAEAFAVSLPLFLLIFAGTYFVLGREQACAFTQAMTRTDALYFTLTVFTTVGFGDIAPVTQTARIITMIQMIGNLVVIGLVARIFLGTIAAGIRRRAGRESE
ncbi:MULTISPECIES: potassium channel family protein [Protofrankia]|uniref:Transporter n=1 Tax=Protofrankia coriariae TaxID=1562887 RepID=A0ABR5F6G8_9ACTN|nr:MULTISPECIES: potassium channel family protein [Protofrankia]KLL12245.1 transporter [Protofrankia coriariae]ONH37826.1 transporter [Protofrankia sp. BMG5.30]